MALPFLSAQPKRKDQIIAIDLGVRATKAIHLQRRGEVFHLAGFTIQDAPPYEKGQVPESMAEHLKAVTAALGGKCKHVVLAVGVQDAFVRQAELPLIPVPDMRMMLKFNAKSYLQQEYTDYSFDCHILPPRAGAIPDPTKPGQKCRVLVGGASNKFVNELQAATKTAGLIAEQVVPGLVGTANAFEVAHPQEFANEVVAMVDIGFRSSVICILMQGEMALTRVVNIGGDKLTTGVGEALGVSYAEAEGIKVGLPEEVQSVMQALLMPLGRELRASIDFFEHQNDRQVSQIYVSGAAARSEFITQTIQAELMVPCKVWNPVNAFQLALPPQQMGEIEQVTSQLPIAVGAAMAAF